MSDIVERLRRINARDWDGDISFAPTEAADEIERLRAELAAERERCAKIADQFTISDNPSVSMSGRLIADRIRSGE